MNLKFSQLVATSCMVALCVSCSSGKKGDGTSSATGWNYNDPDYGFEVTTVAEQETGPGLRFIEGGTFIMGRVEQEVAFNWDNVPRRVTVTSFYIDECEVSNVNYREWLYWISRVYNEYPDQYKMALPDTLVWRRPMAYNEPYVENYLRHPAYNEYPVVGVSWRQASNYCKWRTDRVNENILIFNGVLDPNFKDQHGEDNFDTEAYMYGQYTGAASEENPYTDLFTEEPRQVRLEDGLLLPKYRLPTEAEWEFAALGLVGNTEDERLSSRKIFPWNGHVVRNAEDAVRGQMMANFVRGNGDYMGTSGNLNDKGDITVDVHSYWPNDYGLYCMAGNVNEWVADVYRALTNEDEEEFNPYRGNDFQQKVLNEDGSVAEKDSLGRIRYARETEKSIGNRKNYRKADNKNYLDGDARSNQALGGDWTSSEANTETMYRGTPTTTDLSSLVSDRVRVYKGGGWRDRAYWLSPGTRRFLDEEESRDDIGFRCAMTRVGSPISGQ
ncbi:MAG: SUMF1/EgtB/PvdO family nonheme iron enzyme [Bacteroidales bacterium]|nr:SUMF1/EgtB/PvdO family nonheme iron enzyme [Bacteroidales bacterium]MCR5695708.1 SUMF1/EgtB/PvdO family nonheme iron enzyme [Marinilabiliaceae bacterium]